MSDRNNRISALLNLLQDDDLKVASLAMEEILSLGRKTGETIAEHQDSPDPQMRQRIHQMSSILRRRAARLEFVRDVAQETMLLWEGVCRINQLYDPQCNASQVQTQVDALTRELAERKPVSAAAVAAFMRHHEFSVPESDLVDPDLYLADSVLDTRYGSPVLLCALAYAVGAGAGWHATIVLHEGRYCLMDRGDLVIDPSSGWEIERLEKAERAHPCSARDVWLGVLSQLFMMALVDGQLRDLYHLGYLLTSLNGGTLEDLPHPLGEY